MIELVFRSSLLIGTEMFNSLTTVTAAVLCYILPFVFGGHSLWPYAPQEDPKTFLSSAKDSASKVLAQIHKRWDVDNFPDFLSTVSMLSSGWEVLKTKLELKYLMATRRILEGTPYDDEVKFVISFLGTSVTAGHDSPFNKSFSSRVEWALAPLDMPVRIKFVTRNGAVGNNPCMPYDLCPATYAGQDADMIVIEQSFNCGFGQNENRLHEALVRLAMHMPNQPVIAFSDSLSPNYGEKDCVNKSTLPPEIDPDGMKRLEALKSNHRKNISTTLNRHLSLGEIPKLQHKYRGAGIQMWWVPLQLHSCT